MAQSVCKQYAFRVDSEERAAFNRAVAARGRSAVKEIRRMVDEFLDDQSGSREIIHSFRARKAQEFPHMEVRINALFNETALRRFTVTCQYANVTVNCVLREMIVTYARDYEYASRLREAAIAAV